MPGPKYVKDFEFPSSAGFTGSASDRSTVLVKAHERKRFARGGQVVGNNRGLVSRDPPVAEEERGTSPLRRGYAKGGKTATKNPRKGREAKLGLKEGGLAQASAPMRKAMGGPVAHAKGGRSHGKGSFQRKPMVGC